MKRKYRFNWSWFFLILTGEYVLLFISFRKIRLLFPPPEIGQEQIVGYTQFSGYPLFFDTIFFFVLIFSPIFIMFIMKYLWKNNE